MRSKKLTHIGLALALGAGLLVMVTALLVPPSAVRAAGPPWYVNGSWDGWAAGVQMYDDGTHADAAAADGIYTVQIHVTAIAKYEFKANDSASEWYPASGNAWFFADSDDYTATITLDTNTYTDGWEPVHYIVSADDAHANWTAVGDWQGWNEVNTATVMSLVGSDYKLIAQIATTGTHEYKAVLTGSWDALGPDSGGNSGGRSVNAGTASFTTSYPNQPVAFYADPTTARIRTYVLEPVVINEFAAKGTEWVELYNPTPITITLTGWYVDDADCGSPASTIGAVDLGPGDYFVINAGDVGDNFGLSNSGDVVVLCDNNDMEINRVTYGNLGGAPIGPSASGASQYSTARVVDGQNSNDDALDWNLDPTPTNGSANDVAGNNLGGSVLINEVDLFPATGNDKLELYNPTANPITVTDWYLSDGDDVAVLTGTLSVPAGGFLLLEETVDWIAEGSTGVDFTSSDVAYLFNDSRVRLDQIGFNGHTYNNTPQRIPDGAGPNDGYNWTSSGGDTTWFDLPETLGATNVRSLSISKDGPSVVLQGDVVLFTITYGNMGGSTAQNVVITDTLPAGVDYGGFVTYTTDLTQTGATPPTWDAGAVPSNTTGLTFTVWVTFTGPFSDQQVVDNVAWIDSPTGGFNPVSSTLSTVVVTGTTSIHDIQGSGAASPLDGQSVADVEGVVTAVHAKGFYMQEPDADTNPQTSEGIYVYTYNAPTVKVGDMAEVDGEVDEYYDMTQLKNVTVITTSSGHTITATEVTLPLVQADDYEAYEGMLVTFPQKLTVNDVYDLGRYGSATLAQGGRLFNPTNVITPGTPANDLQAANDLRTLVLDDGSSTQNPDPIPYPSPALSATNTLRSGDAVTDVTGVLSYDYGAYKLHPTSTPNFVHENARTTAPAAVSGTLKVASFNVLNYFDTFSGCTGGVGGAIMDCRGADNTEEFDRQRDKIIDAILDIDADIVGLMEIENDGYGDESSAIDDLVDGLNDIAGAGTYAYINADTAIGVTNTLGTDAIKVGLLYKPGTVILTGTTAALNDSTAISGTNFYDMKNRPVLAQSFQEQATGEIVTILVNHLKSKGSDCDDAPYNDPDTGDGQGNCNLTRQAATEAMLAWLATDPTGVNDADYLIIGDLNAYAMEDPIMTLQDGGFTNLIASYIGAEAYSYVFYGQAGYLDHALASQTLLSQIADTTIWHINADEPKVLDYNTEYKTAGQIISLYNVDPYRASDHDPVVIGLELKPPEYKIYLPLVLRNSP
jgi:uncharacterized repeat protein (TIGR01451 family)